MQKKKASAVADASVATRWEKICIKIYKVFCSQVPSLKNFSAAVEKNDIAMSSYRTVDFFECVCMSSI